MYARKSSPRLTKNDLARVVVQADRAREGVFADLPDPTDEDVVRQVNYFHKDQLEGQHKLAVAWILDHFDDFALATNKAGKLPKSSKPYAEQVAEKLERDGFAGTCKHGHPDCSLREGGHCSDELSQAKKPDLDVEDDSFREVCSLREENRALTEKLGKALEMLRETEDRLRDLGKAVLENAHKEEAEKFAAREAIKAARREAEAKAIDALARYKFQMFGYWAACWVHANSMAKAAGMEVEPSPFWALVKLAEQIDANVMSGRKPEGGEA